MKNVLSIKRTTNSSGSTKLERTADTKEFLFLNGEKRTYAQNLLKDWIAQIRHIQGLKNNTIDNHSANVLRLLNFAQVAPWELKPTDVTNFFESKYDHSTGKGISPSTYAGYCSSWRSFQNFMCEPDIANQIYRTFNIRPIRFVNDENSIAVRKYKSNHGPKAWALSLEQIDAMDEEFKNQIKVAYQTRSKALLPLQRDRVMFNLCIHFALRVTELITLQLNQFSQSEDQRLKDKFDKYGQLTVTGKNDVSGTIPMRELDIYNLLMWYLENVRPKILLRRKDKNDGFCTYDGQSFRTAQLLFPSGQGGVMTHENFGKRLKSIALATGVIDRRVTPHTLRHTGCTLMVPLYSPEIAQKYMRHKNLYTTLGYYHPIPLDAASEPNRPLGLFDDEDD